MRLFTEEQPLLSIGAISRQLGLHKSTVSRIVGALRAEGLVEMHGESGQYGLGMGLVTLAGVALGQITVRGIAWPLMEQLAQEAVETVSLWVLRENSSVCVAHMPAPQSIRYVVWTGRRVPLGATASGKVLLAGVPQPQRQAYLQRPLTMRTPHTILDRVRLEETVAATAVFGYALEVDEFEMGTAALAAPVFDHTGQVTAALSVAGPSYRLGEATRRELVAPLQTHAHTISCRLGFGGAYPFAQS